MPFVLDVERSRRDHKRRTTLASVKVGFTALHTAGLVDRNYVGVPALYAAGGQIHKGTYDTLAKDCAPEFLGQDWPDGIVGHLNLIQAMQPLLEGKLNQQRSGRPAP